MLLRGLMNYVPKYLNARRRVVTWHQMELTAAQSIRPCPDLGES